MIWLKNDGCANVVRRDNMKFYTIKLPKFLGGLVRAMIGAFKKE
jgi:stage V sporulation protein M